MTNDELENKSMGLLLIFLALVLIFYLATNGTKPIQQQSPSYNGQSWQTTIITTNDDHHICVGYCPDYEYQGR